MTVKLGYTIYYVDDVEATLSFFEQGFGLARRFLTPEGDYGELETGATTLAFASTELAASNLDSAGGFARLADAGGPGGFAITLICDDVPATIQSALDAGASRYVDPVQKPWGQQVAYVLDPNGALIEIATAVAA